MVVKTIKLLEIKKVTSILVKGASIRTTGEVFIFKSGDLFLKMVRANQSLDKIFNHLQSTILSHEPSKWTRKKLLDYREY